VNPGRSVSSGPASPTDRHSSVCLGCVVRVKLNSYVCDLRWNHYSPIARRVPIRSTSSRKDCNWPDMSPIFLHCSLFSHDSHTDCMANVLQGELFGHVTTTLDTILRMAP